MIPYIVGAICLLLVFSPIMWGFHAWYTTWRWQREQQRQWEQEVWNNRFQESLSQMNGYRYTNGNTLH